MYLTDCVSTAVFLINQTPSLLLGKKSPYEILTRKIPDYSFLKSFGCFCYVSTLTKDRTKFTSRADECVFLGYSAGYKGYRVLHLDTHIISVSHNVVFKEYIFPFKTSNTSSSHIDLFSRTILPMSTPPSIDSLIHVHQVPSPALPISRETASDIT